MGEIINFGGKKFNIQARKEHKTDDLISLLPKLKNLKDEIIVIKINIEVIENDRLLISALKEIVTLKCMGAVVILIPDVNDKIEEYFEENQGIKNIFADNNFIDTNGLTDVLEVIIKRNICLKICKFLQDYNIMSMVLSGNDMNIVLSDDVVNNNIENFSFTAKSIHNQTIQSKKKYSIDILNDIIKTDIIPIVMPTFKDNHGNEYLMDSGMYAMYMSKYLNALKYVLIYNDNSEIPTACIYGIERFSKMIKGGHQKMKTMQAFNSTIEAVKNGVQCSHLIDIENTSLLEALCLNDNGGFCLYDDTLNQL